MPKAVGKAKAKQRSTKKKKAGNAIFLLKVAELNRG